MTDEERTPATRARAETALVRLCHELGDDTARLIVLGGLVPAMLTRDAHPTAPEHLGTTDVDILLITHVDVETNLGAVERALERIDFSAEPQEDGWRWRGALDGFPVRIEFLCDLEEYAAGETIRPSGCRILSAVNLRGTGYVARDFEWMELHGRLPDGESVTVSVRFAGLQGYLLSKCVAARTRAADKDYYDFVYVLQHNRLGGPEQAALEFRDGPFADDLPALSSTFLELRERFRHTTDVGPMAYEAQALQAQPEAEPAELRADAVDVVRRYLDGLTP